MLLSKITMGVEQLTLDHSSQCKGAISKTASITDLICSDVQFKTRSLQLTHIYPALAVLEPIYKGLHRLSSYFSALTRLVRRSEEHTSELQSLAYLVCRLLLEKKKIH